MRKRPAAVLVLACALASPFAARGARAAEPWSAPIFRAPKGPKPPPTPVAPAPADVETAEALFGKLEFEEANKVADRVTKLRGLTHDQLVRAYKILAITHAFIDHEDPAREAFVLLMTYEPDYQVDPNQGPKVTTPFYEARGFWRSQPTKPGLDVAAQVRGQESGTLRITTRDPTHIVKRVAVGYRWGQSGDYTTSSNAPGNGVQVEVPAPPTGKSRLEYYVQALDDRDDVAFESGNPLAPKSAIADTSAPPMTPPDSGRDRDKDKGGGGIFSSPIFWTITGIVVVGGATTAFLVLRPKDTAAPTQASLAPSLQCGTTKCN